MLIWVMAATVLASILVFAGLLLYAWHDGKRHAAIGLAVEQEVAGRFAMPAEEARSVAEGVIAAQAIVEPWDDHGSVTVASELARLHPDIEALLGAQKRLTFPVDDVVLSAVFMRSASTHVPPGMSHIGFADDSGYAIYAYQDGRPDVATLRASDGRPEMQFGSVFHLIAVLADADLGKVPRGPDA